MPTQVQAEETILFRGTADLGSCNRIKYYRDSFGNRLPTNQSVGQYGEAKIYLSHSVEEVVSNKLKACAVDGVKRAAILALVTSAAGAWPAFEASFKACASTEGALNALKDNVAFDVKTHCRW